MKNTVIGILLATLALYVWGFLYWGANPLPYHAWKQTKDDAAAGQALLEHFPESGTYYIPGNYNDEETQMRLSEQGPVAFIHITARQGRPLHDVGVMVKGFFLYLAIMIVMTALLKQALPALPTFSSKVKFTALAGLAAALLIDIGDAVWWHIPWEWKLHQAFYNFSAWVIAGLVLAKFIKPEKND